MLAAGLACWALAVACVRTGERRAARRTGPRSPRREPPPPVLTPGEEAMLAALAARYGHGDTRAGRRLADHLRRRCPGVPDADLMRCVIALGTAARWFTRHELTAADAMAAYITAMDTAALDLTELERNEIPR